MTEEDSDPARGMYEYDPKARARALQSLLIEEGLVSTDAVDAVVSRYEEDIGPMRGAEVVARAWTDEDYREWLLEDATAAIEAEFGYTGRAGTSLGVLENTPDTHNVIVCTLCSCYPWPLLGLPPTWYKTPSYRARMVKVPRAVLSEDFDTEVPDSVDVHVKDVSGDVRYMVLPRRPSGTEGMTEAELADLVTRDAMVGVERLVS